MASVYSKLLAHQHVAYPGGLFTFVVGSPGETVVIRDMTAVWTPVPGTLLGQGFTVSLAPADILWTVRHPHFLASKVYRWQGRQVLAGGSSLQLGVFHWPFDLWVSGYLFAS